MTGPGWQSWIILVSILEPFIHRDKMRRNHFKGINYWLKAKLLASTDIGEYGQFWLGAESQVDMSQV